jgi:(R,R)-butanediol dehydrogenase/meso-butanediol dehydrogenase/diacetyl reductase/L-iditol 2-dehydrogenase
MKAAIWKEVGFQEVEDVPEPQPGPDEIKLKVAYCGICGTDPEIIAGHFPPVKPPSIIGHENSGTIVEMGSNVQDYQVGQRVAVNFRSYCGGCYYCRNRMEHFCENVGHSTGGYAEYAVFHKNSVYLLPDDVSMEVGALTEPVSVAVHAIDLANIHTGSSVAIFGAGAIGLLLLQLAIRSGAAKVLVSEPIARKRQLALDMGADVVVDPLNDDVEEAGRKLTDAIGFDTVIEASGKVGPAKQAIFMAAKCGTVLWAAVYPEHSEIGVSPYHMYANELTIRSILVSPYTFPRSIALLLKLDLEPLITDIIPLEDINSAFDLHKKGESVKILIRP